MYYRIFVISLILVSALIGLILQNALCEIKKRNQHPIEKFAHQCQSACARYV